MNKSIDSNKLKELSKILKIDQTEVKDYFSDLNDDKFIQVFKKIKRNRGLLETTDYISFILDITNYKILDELSTRLLENIELLELVENSMSSNNNNNNNRFIQELVNILKEEQVDNKIAYSDGDTVIYVWTREEEQDVFKKYNSAREELKNYIINNNYTDVIEYAKSIPKKRYPEKYKNKDAEFKLEYIIERLYSKTFDEEECLVLLRKDPKAIKLIDNCKEIRDDISLHNYGLVKSIALNDKYQYRGLSPDDLIQEGNIGLLAAIEKFDVTRGIKFSTYAANGIILCINRAIANEGTTIRIPAHLHEKRVKVNRIIKMLKDMDGIEEPSIEDIYEKCNEEGLNISLEQVVTAVDFESIGNPLSYDQQYNGEDYTLKDFIFATSEETTYYAEKNNDLKMKEQYLNNIEKGLTRFGVPTNKKNEDYLFYKQISLYDDTGLIKILLDKEEYKYYILGVKKYGKERLLEFLNKYGINPDTVSSNFKVDDFTLTRNQLEVLIYRMRNGIHNNLSKKIIVYRNRNNALYDIESGYHTKEITQDKLGKLFGVSREIIRRSEERINKKMGDGEDDSIILLLDQKPENLFTLFNIINPNNHLITISNNEIIRVDEEYNIYPLKRGHTDISILNIKTGKLKKVVIKVRPSLDDKYVSKKKLVNK